MKAIGKRDTTTNSPNGGAGSTTGGRRSVRMGENGGRGASGHYFKGNMDDGDSRSLGERLHGVKEELRSAQETFISRERVYQLRIEELEEALLKKRQTKIGWMQTDPKINELKTMQGQILSNVALVQDRFSRVMQEQEQDLLRAFQARLLDVQAELEMQKSKKDDGAVAYIELSKVKQYDVEKEKVRADLKERQNQALLQANNRLKNQFSSREEDRNFLVMQINAARNDNARLRNEHEDHEREKQDLEKQVAEMKSRLEEVNGGPASPLRQATMKRMQTSAQLLQSKLDAEERYKEVNQRLKKLLAEERRSHMQVKQNFNQELSARTEMEMLLRDCVEEVKREKDNRQRDLDKYTMKKLKLEEDDDPEQQAHDRERVLELLLSKEAVIHLIYQKSSAAGSGSMAMSGKVQSFQKAPPSPGSAGEDGAGGNVGIGLTDLEGSSPTAGGEFDDSAPTSSKLPPLSKSGKSL